MFDEPDELARVTLGDCDCACLHRGERLIIGDLPVAHAPFGRRKPLRGKAKAELVADVNHLLTIPW